MDENYTLWLDLQRFACFKIPNDARPPAGETTLYTFLGQTRRVDLASVAAWELPVSEVQSYLQVRILQVLGQSQAHLSPQELQTFLDSLADALADTIADDAARLENARHWARGFRLTAKQFGAEVDSSVEVWPEVIRATYLASNTQPKFHELVEWLRTLAAQIEQPAGSTEDLGQVLTRLSQFIDGLFKADETDDERRQRYRDMARQAMPPIPRPDIKQMIEDYKAGK